MEESFRYSISRFLFHWVSGDIMPSTTMPLIVPWLTGFYRVFRRYRFPAVFAASNSNQAAFSFSPIFSVFICWLSTNFDRSFRVSSFISIEGFSFFVVFFIGSVADEKRKLWLVAVRSLALQPKKTPPGLRSSYSKRFFDYASSKIKNPTTTQCDTSSCRSISLLFLGFRKKKWGFRGRNKARALALFVWRHFEFRGCGQWWPFFAFCVPRALGSNANKERDFDAITCITMIVASSIDCCDMVLFKRTTPKSNRLQLPRW